MLDKTDKGQDSRIPMVKKKLNVFKHKEELTYPIFRVRKSRKITAELVANKI
jgi:hypothetical protein